MIPSNMSPHERPPGHSESAPQMNHAGTEKTGQGSSSEPEVVDRRSEIGCERWEDGFQSSILRSQNETNGESNESRPPKGGTPNSEVLVDGAELLEALKRTV